MSEQLTLERIYGAILKTGWLSVDEKGLVYRALDEVNGEKKEAFIMLDKQVALPTRENLGRSGRDNLLIFHPLLEGLVGGESPVIGKLRRAYSIRFNFVGPNLFEALLAGASHTTEYSKFSPEQMELFKVVKQVNEKTLKTWERIVNLAIERYGASNAFVDVYTSRNTQLNNQSYSRVASVRFPIYEEIVKGEKIFGSSLQLSKNEREIFTNLFEFMFPGIEEKDHYSYGTNSRIAPYLDAVLKVFGRLFQHTNKLYDMYNSVILMESNLRVDIDWVDWTMDIESLKTLAQSVPQQYGNYPIKVEDEKRQTTGSDVKALEVQKQASIGYVPQRTETMAQPQTRTSVPQNPHQPLPMPQALTSDQPQKFTGIGKPLTEANGVFFEKPKSLEATIINNSQGRAMINPIQAAAQTALEVIKHGGVGRVSANAVNPAATTGFNMNTSMPMPQNNNGWSSPINNNNGWGGAQQPPAALILREQAIQRMMGNNSVFGNGNNFNRGSPI